MGVAHPRAVGGTAGGRQTSARIVRDLIEASVRDGIFAEDEQLVEHILMEELGASRTAVRSALQIIADEGIAIRRPRVGTFPATRPIRVELTDTVNPDEASRFSLESLGQRRVPSLDLLRQLLQTDDPELRMMDWRFRYDSEPIGVRTAYFRTVYTKLLSHVTWTGPIDKEVIGRDFFDTTRFVAARTEVGAARADAQTARLLGVEEGAPIVTRRQLMVDGDGSPVQVTFDQYLGSKVTLVDGLVMPADPRNADSGPEFRAS